MAVQVKYFSDLELDDCELIIQTSLVRLTLFPELGNHWCPDLVNSTQLGKCMLELTSHTISKVFWICLWPFHEPIPTDPLTFLLSQLGRWFPQVTSLEDRHHVLVNPVRVAEQGNTQNWLTGLWFTITLGTAYPYQCSSSSDTMIRVEVAAKSSI